MDRIRWLIDGMNVLGSRADGWWRDRDAGVRRLVADLQRFAETRDVTVVFDGAPVDDLVEGRHGAIIVRYAPVADDAIVELVTRQPGRWRVVTSDRELRERAAAAGAEVEGAGGFLRRVAASDNQ